MPNCWDDDEPHELEDDVITEEFSEEDEMICPRCMGNGSVSLEKFCSCHQCKGSGIIYRRK